MYRNALPVKEQRKRRREREVVRDSEKQWTHFLVQCTTLSLFVQSHFTLCARAIHIVHQIASVVICYIFHFCNFYPFDQTNYFFHLSIVVVFFYFRTISFSIHCHSSKNVSKHPDTEFTVVTVAAIAFVVIA